MAEQQETRKVLKMALNGQPLSAHWLSQYHWILPQTAETDTNTAQLSLKTFARPKAGKQSILRFTTYKPKHVTTLRFNPILHLLCPAAPVIPTPQKNNERYW